MVRGRGLLFPKLAVADGSADDACKSMVLVRFVTERILFKARIPTDVGNAAAREGELGEMIAKILADQKPEAAYFTDENGMRCAYLILEIESSSEIPRISEPWLLSFNAADDFFKRMLIDKESTQ